MNSEPRPDLMTGYKEIGDHIGMTERQTEHLLNVYPQFPKFYLGRKVCALRSKVDAWLADQAAQKKVEGVNDNERT